MPTEALANWTVSLTPSSLPEKVISAAVRSFYNWAGCTIGGSAHEATRIARSALARARAAPHAALFNGIASHVHDYDDTHLDTIIHPTGPVAAALLAMAESFDTPVPGAAFVTALVAGIEVECKLGRAVWPAHYDVGWHITSTTGSIGAAVAVSKLLNLSRLQTAHAIGLAATQFTGLREMFGSHAKSFHAGRAAQNGLLAAVLASGGYTASTQALEAKRGWANVNAFKPFPCGIVVHPVIDACIWLHGELERRGIEVAQIGEVCAEVHPLVLELTGKTAPRDGLEAKFSVYHGAAVGLLLGKAAPAQYEDAVVNDAQVVRLRERIRATPDDNLRPDECRLAVSVHGPEEVIKKHVDHAVGSLVRPMTDAQLTEKFVDQCTPILGVERTERASQWCWDLNNQVDVRRIKDVL